MNVATTIVLCWFAYRLGAPYWIYAALSIGVLIDVMDWNPHDV